jgi:hypothetical protein
MGWEEQFDLEGIREFVMNRLSEDNGLLPNAFPITERTLYRHDEACGVFFCLHGPRSIRLTAVFDIETDRLLLYDSRGCRTGSFKLEKPNELATSAIVASDIE